MNIFVLDQDQKKAAEYHCNKHVVKMIVETAQLLSFIHHLSGSGMDWMYKLSKTHSKHPCTIWTLKSLDNYIWLCNLGLSLCSEYTYRYGKVHKTEEKILQFLNFLPHIPNIGLTEFALAMPLDYVNKRSDIFETAIDSYRKYYIEDKQHIAHWKNRDIPYWFKFKDL